MAANDNAPPRPRPSEAFRMVPLIGAVHDDGRVERLGVVELLRVPLAALRSGGRGHDAGD